METKNLTSAEIYSLAFIKEQDECRKALSEFDNDFVFKDGFEPQTYVEDRFGNDKIRFKVKEVFVRKYESGGEGTYLKLQAIDNLYDLEINVNELDYGQLTNVTLELTDSNKQ